MDQNLKFLLVDDDETEAIFFEDALNNHFQKHSLHYESGFDDTLKYLQNHLPDAIILDMRMPNKSGLDLLTELRNRKALRTIPIYLVSGLACESSKQIATERGAQGFYAKPLAPEAYFDLVGSILNDVKKAFEYIQDNDRLPGEIFTRATWDNTGSTQRSVNNISSLGIIRHVIGF